MWLLWLSKATYLWNTSRLLPAQLIRLVDEHVCRDGNILSVSASVRKAENSIAFLEAVLAFSAELFDRTGELNAHCCRSLRRERVQAFTLEEIHAVQTKSFHFDESL